MRPQTTAIARSLTAIGLISLLLTCASVSARPAPAESEPIGDPAAADRQVGSGPDGEHDVRQAPADDRAHAGQVHAEDARDRRVHARRADGGVHADPADASRTRQQGQAHGEDGNADDDHGHERASAPQDDWWHRVQDWLIELIGGVHPHGDEHGNDHAEPQALTLYGEATELFAELPPLVAGERAELLLHLTRLSDHKPVADGEVTVAFSGAGAAEETFTAEAPSRPGLFRVAVIPAVPGERRVRLALDAPGLREMHDLGPVPVHPDAEAAEAAHPAGESGREQSVLLLKEQQWQSDFATALAAARLLRESVPATGLLRPSADGEAHVTSPIDAHLTPAPGGFPYTGLRVEAGQVIAYLVPQLGGEADVAGLELAVTRASSLRDLAGQERERLDALWRERSVPYRDVLEARSAEEVAAAELTAARRRLAQVQRTEEGEAAGMPIRAPITALVARVDVAPGGFVEEGDRLFQLVDPERLWLEARVAEADIGCIQVPAGAWFRVQGFAETFDVSPADGARLVAFGAMVDPESRTVPAIFEFPRPDPRLRVGLAVSARVFTGEEQMALAVPAGALVNDAGADVVYVQTGGERFERRLVRTGLRDGEYVAIAAGLAPGERVVSRGAYLVHLAAGAPAEAGHGHAH